MPCGQQVSPRSRERGPVEAYSEHGHSFAQLAALSALTSSAAPLKLSDRALRPYSWTRSLSPRSIERGPVEATCTWHRHGQSVYRPLRAQLSAAPLKRQLSCRRSAQLCEISPRSIERGPVEA